jgi:uncharacterized membrane-anchored protein YitT (DUF2179 family)
MIKRELKNAILLAAGVLSAGFGIEGFLLSSHFIDGGVTGASMLIGQVSGVPLSIILPIVNLPFVVLGYKQLGLAFAVRSMVGIAGLAIALVTVHFPDVTPDLLLTAVFGGFFLGAGIGLAVRSGAVLDGTEIAALIISRRSRMLKVGEIVLIFNVVLFIVAIAVLGVQPALYSILTYISAAKTLDFIVYGLEEYTAIMIVSPHSAEIRARIIGELDRAVTVLKGQRGRSGQDQDIIYCVVTRLEIGRVRQIVQAEDPAAFIISHALSDVEGGVVKRGALH